MALIRKVRGFTPKIGKDCFLAETAVVVGDVTMGDECSIWYNTVLRGDVNTITIGNRVNIQDGSVLHTLYEKSVIEIGDDVSIGHNVTIHGAKICDGALVGMGSGRARPCRRGRRRHCCRRCRGTEQDRHRPRRTVGRHSGQIHQEGRCRTVERIEPEDSPQLPVYSRWYDEE